MTWNEFKKVVDAKIATLTITNDVEIDYIDVLQPATGDDVVVECDDRFGVVIRDF